MLFAVTPGRCPSCTRGCRRVLHNACCTQAEQQERPPPTTSMAYPVRVRGIAGCQLTETLMVPDERRLSRFVGAHHWHNVLVTPVLQLPERRCTTHCTRRSASVTELMLPIRPGWVIRIIEAVITQSSLTGTWFGSCCWCQRMASLSPTAMTLHGARCCLPCYNDDPRALLRVFDCSALFALSATM